MSQLTGTGKGIYIPQHSKGHAKEIAARDTREAKGFCRVKAVEGRTCLFEQPYQDIRYTCDVEGGGSGSPVLLNATNKVIAVHHCGDYGSCYGNTGVPMVFIYPFIAPFINKPATQSPSSAPSLDPFGCYLREETLTCDMPRNIALSEKLNLNWPLTNA